MFQALIAVWIYLVDNVIEGWDSTKHVRLDNKSYRNGSRIGTITDLTC